MARGKKNLTLEEQHEKITKEISDMKDALQAAEKTKKEIEKQIKMNRLSELDEMIQSSGKSIDEVKEFLGVGKEKDKSKK